MKKLFWPPVYIARTVTYIPCNCIYIYIIPRVDNYLGRVSNGPINCDTTARMFTSVFTKYTELISVFFKFMGVVEKMALEACRKL